MTERTVGLGDGARTTLQVWGESGPLLLCVHGMTSSRRAWRRLGDALAGRYRVAAYDQRGHGDSAGVTGPMTLARCEEDLHDVERALGEPVEAYVGHSWGGAVVLRAGARGTGPRVIAIDPMIRQYADADYDEYVTELREAFVLTGEERDAATRQEFASWASEDSEGKVHATHAMTVAPIEGLRDENPAASWDFREAIATYARPLLLLFPNREDGINDAATIDEVVARHAPATQIVWFPGEGHNLHRTYFDGFLRASLAFLSSD